MLTQLLPALPSHLNSLPPALQTQAQRIFFFPLNCLLRIAVGALSADLLHWKAEHTSDVKRFWLTSVTGVILSGSS